MNHSRKLIRGFVDIVTTIMDKRVCEHVRVIDPVTCRKRVFVFMVDKVMELHRTGDAVAVLIISEEGELQVMFADYLLLIGHTCFREADLRQDLD
jgi:hypothetical protein